MSDVLTHRGWLDEARHRFGDDQMNWAFVCPVCKHIQTAQDYRDAGAPSSAVGFSCVGRWVAGSKDAFHDKGAGPCTYAGGGLFRLNPVKVTLEDGIEMSAFAFAEKVGLSETEPT